MIDIAVPQWGLTMEEATFIRWLCNEGDVVTLDQPVAEIETDKVTAEVTSPAAGTIVELLVGPGDELKPGQTMGRLREG